MFQRLALIAVIFGLSFGMGANTPAPILAPVAEAASLGMLVNPGEEEVQLTVQAEQGEAFTLQIFTLSTGPNGLIIDTQSLPLRTDATGVWTLDLALRDFSGLPDSSIYVQLLDRAGTQVERAGEPYIFRLDFRSVAFGSTGSPTMPGGGQVSGTSPNGRTLVTSWASVLDSSAGTPVWLDFVCTPHGVEGVIPVN